MTSEAEREIAWTDAPKPWSHINTHTHTHTHSYWVIHQGDISRSSVQAYSAFQRPGSLSWNNVSLVATAEVRSYGVGVNEEHKVAQRWNVEPACKPILNIIIELNISNVCVISQIKWLECGFFVHWGFFLVYFIHLWAVLAHEQLCISVEHCSSSPICFLFVYYA